MAPVRPKVGASVMHAVVSRTQDRRRCLASWLPRPDIYGRHELPSFGAGPAKKLFDVDTQRSYNTPQHVDRWIAFATLYA
jgi:hypothetical protein